MKHLRKHFNHWIGSNSQSNGISTFTSVEDLRTSKFIYNTLVVY